MATNRQLPDALRAKSGGRTDAALRALNDALDEIDKSVAENGYRGDPFTLAYVMEKAGLGQKFLYGDKHKDTTKFTVEKRLKKINDRVSAPVEVPAEAPTELDIAVEEAEYWKGRFEKLANQYNLAFARIRDLQRTIRDNKFGTGRN